jgi:translation initiation factor 5
MLNIPSSVDDPSYRYKMPRIVSKKEGRGNGSKTGIHNMGDVARALKRDPVYLTKFFGYELGAQTSYTNKENEGERAVVNGHHDTNIFQTLVDKFIEKYVLCSGCNLPEIDMVVNKKGIIVATCKACGWNGDLDNHHRLATYISKNPPGTGIGFDEDKPKKSREERQKEKSKKGKKKEDDDETASYQSEDEKAKVKKEKKSKKEKKDKDSDDDDDVKEKKEKKEKKKEKKEKKEKKDKKDKKEKKKEKSDSDESGSEKDSDEEELEYNDEIMSGTVNDMVSFVKSKGDKLNVSDMFEEVRAQQVTKCFDDKLRMYVVVSALFPEGSLQAKGVASRMKYIKKFISNGNLSFSDWMWGFEAYLAANPVATKAWAMTLKALYDEEGLAEEEQVLKYYKEERSNPGFLASQKAAAPFIKWLETVDDSDDSDDDSDSEDSD